MFDMAHGTSPVDHFLAQNLDAPERQGRLQASTIRNLCILILAFIMASALIFVGGMKSSELRTLAQDVLKKHHSSLPSSFQDRVASGTDERGDSTAQKTNAQVPPDRVPDLGKLPSEISSLNDVMNAIRVDWRGVIKSFLDTAPSNAYSAKRITSLFESGVNNVKNTSMLVSIRDREVTFTEEYPENRNGRAPSAKYIINKIVDEAEISLPDMTFLLIINDGYPTDVVTFGPARHWKSWNSTIPVPLGNDRGLGKGWGTPIEGWDSYVEQNVVSSHGNYPWESKFEKAVFRGSLSKRSSKLGSCNVENNGACEQAENWRQVTRGILYEKTSQHPDLFDVAITALKMEGAEKGWSAGAPVPVEPMQVQDYQKFKYILNVGNNQDWAERIRSLLFMNSAVIYHMAESQEFFTPLLKPWVHFIPTDLHFQDLSRHVQWAKRNDHLVQQIVRNQIAFAHWYISESAMQLYWEILLLEFSNRQSAAASES